MKNLNRDKFRDCPLNGTKEDIFKELHELLRRIIVADSEKQETFLQWKLVLWLQEKNQLDAAKWFEENWTGCKGSWTSGNGGFGNVRSNRSVEAFIGQLKNHCSRFRWLEHLDESVGFLGSLVGEVTECSKEHRTKLLHPGNYGVASFEKYAAATPALVARLQYVHPITFLLSEPFFQQKDWIQGMRILYCADKDGNIVNSVLRGKGWKHCLPVFLIASSKWHIPKFSHEKLRLLDQRIAWGIPRHFRRLDFSRNMTDFAKRIKKNACYSP